MSRRKIKRRKLTQASFDDLPESEKEILKKMSGCPFCKNGPREIIDPGFSPAYLNCSFCGEKEYLTT